MPAISSNTRNSWHELQQIQSRGTVDVDVSRPSWRSLFNFTTRAHLPHLSIALIFTILSSLLQPAGAIIYGKIFTVLTLYGSGRISPHDILEQNATLCTALVVLGIISWFVEFGFLSMWMSFGELQAKSVREQMLIGMLRKDMDWYDLREDGTGSLLIRIETQIRELQLSLSQPLGFCVYEISVCVVALGLGFYFSWKLTLVILATLPILAIVLFFVSKRLEPAVEAQKQELSLAAKFTHTAIANVNTVKAYNGQDHENWQYYATVKRVATSYLLQARANAMQFGFIKFATVGLFIQGFWFGLVLVNQGVDPGHIFTTYYTCLIAMQSIEIVLPQWLILAKGKSAGHTLKSIIKELEREDDQKVNKLGGSVTPAGCSGDIELKNVSFSYPSNQEKKVMTGVNFFFPANETTYIIGRSGSGKSTVGNLLLKYYDIYQGDILVDGYPIQSLSLEWLRRNITLVQQESVLFNETVLQNIAFGKQTPASRDEILEAVYTADLEETLKNLPEGLETVVGLTGKSLSGGQQQRVALARARLRDSAIVILDEATSALDQKSRARVMERIREWRRGKTTIIITHDVSRILDDEYVYVLEHGAIVQEGYCKTLAEKKHGIFASFLPADNAVSPLSVRRNSEPKSWTTPSPKSGLPNSDELHVQSSFISKLLDTNETSRKRFSFHDGPQALASLSLGTGSVRNSFVQAFDHLNTPEPPSKAIFDSLDPIIQQGSASSAPAQNIGFQSNIVTVPFLSMAASPRSSIYREQTLPVQQSSSYSPGTNSGGLCAEKTPPSKSLTRGNREIDGTTRPPPLARLDTSFTSNSRMSRALSRKGLERKAQLEKSLRSVGSSLDPEKLSPLQVKTASNLPETHEPLNSKTSASIRSEKPQNRTAASMSQILRTIWPMLDNKDRGILIFGFFASFIVAVATPAFAYVLAQLLNVYYLPTNRSAVAQKWALTLIGIAIVDGCATFWSHLALEYSAQQWVNGLRVEALKRILAQPRSWFDKEKNSPERLSECLDRNAEEMRNLVGRFMGPVFITTWIMGITIVWALVISYRYTLVAMACFPVIYVSARIYDFITTRWEDRCNQAAATSSSIFTETVSNIRVVRALTLEGHFKQKHEKSVQTAWKTGLRRGLYSGLMFGTIDSFSFFVVATIFRYGTVAAVSGTLSLLNMLQVINLLLFGISKAVSLLNLMPQINSSRTTGTQMLYLAQLPSHSGHESGGTKRIPTPFPVVFNNLSFTHPNRAEGKTLNNINLTIKAGTCTAIVGPSGSGKSTIASLLLGLYPPDFKSPHESAPLTFSSVPISELNLTSLRNFVSIVAQQPLLFPTTIYDNITYGLPECSPYLNLASAVRAAEDAGIHEFVLSLPAGYNTLIGEGGVGISGGQAQRIAIARALVRKPKILILDEATSALDKVSADAIKACVTRIMLKTRLEDVEAERTAVVIISHDVEMMRVAERICVVESGKVVEEGTFQELSRIGKAFRILTGREVAQEQDDTRAEQGDGWDAVTPVNLRSTRSWVRTRNCGGLRQTSV